MRKLNRSGPLVLILVFAGAPTFAEQRPDADAGIRILSWNITDDAFVAEAVEFQSLLRWADPDIVLLDQVSPLADIDELHAGLANLQPGDDGPWYVSVGTSGGRQRDVIASRAPQEALPEFSTIIPYPDADKRNILARVSDVHRSYTDYSMDYGIPVNAAIIVIDGKRLLTVIFDLQCCGDGPDSWPEYRRQVEAREIRQRIEQVLERTTVDSLVIAGDFNLVHGMAAAQILNKPYPICSDDLSPAELYRPESDANWTWDGRGMPFPNGRLDFQFYCPDSLQMLSGFILDSEGLAPETLQKLELKSDTSKRTGRHRPLLAEYLWKHGQP